MEVEHLWADIKLDNISDESVLSFVAAVVKNEGGGTYEVYGTRDETSSFSAEMSVDEVIKSWGATIESITMPFFQDRSLSVLVRSKCTYITIGHRVWEPIDKLVDLWKGLAKVGYRISYESSFIITKEVNAKDFWKQLVCFVSAVKEKFGREKTIGLITMDAEEEEIEFDEERFIDQLRGTAKTLKNVSFLQLLNERDDMSCDFDFQLDEEDSYLICKGVRKEDLIEIVALWNGIAKVKCEISRSH